MHPVPRPFVLGSYEFWTVEGIWQGTKIVRLAHPTHVTLPHEPLGSNEIWFPQAGSVKVDVQRSDFFRCLKSGRGYDAKRDRAFGKRNWAFAGHWDPSRAVRLSTEAARVELHERFYAEQLAQFPATMARLRRSVEISDAMVATHPHLRVPVRGTGP